MSRWLTGWTCPKCGRVVSAAYEQCPHCLSAGGPPGQAEDRSAEPQPRSTPTPPASPRAAYPAEPDLRVSEPASRAPTSAVEAISPAFQRTKRELFQPFRFGRWARLAFVSLVTGEFLGSGAGSLGSGGNITGPQRGGRGAGPDAVGWFVHRDWLNDPQLILLELSLVVGILLVVGLLWAYAASVHRFILFDAVLNDRCELRKARRQWKRQGRHYFGWQICFGLGGLTLLSATVGVPALLAWRVGVFHDPERHAGLLILGGIALFFAVVFLILLGSLVSVLANDFLIPLMALEGLTVTAAWRRLLALLNTEKKAYTGYILMKIVLAVGSALLFGIINFIVLVLPLIAIGLMVALAPLPSIAWTPLAIAAAILLGVIALLGLFVVVCFVSAPAMVFFHSYAIHFFSSRYPALSAAISEPAVDLMRQTSPATPLG